MAEPHWNERWAADPRSTRTPSLGSTPARGKSAYLTTSTPNSTKSPPHRTVDLAKSCVQPSLNTSSTLRPGSGTQSPGVDSRRCVGAPDRVTKPSLTAQVAHPWRHDRAFVGAAGRPGHSPL